MDRPVTSQRAVHQNGFKAMLENDAWGRAHSEEQSDFVIIQIVPAVNPSKSQVCRRQVRCLRYIELCIIKDDDEYRLPCAACNQRPANLPQDEEIVVAAWKEMYAAIDYKVLAGCTYES